MGSSQPYRIDFFLAKDGPPNCEKIIFKIGDAPIVLTRKAHKKDNKKDTFPWGAGTIGFIILMIRYKLEYRPGTKTHEFPAASRGTIQASAYDVIEKSNWLSQGFDYKFAEDQAPGVFNLRQLTKEVPKKVGIQINADLLTPKNVRFHFGDSSANLSFQELRKIKNSLTRNWQRDQPPSRPASINKFAKAIERRMKRGERMDYALSLIPPTIVKPQSQLYWFRNGSTSKKIAIIKRSLISLLTQCEHLAKAHNYDIHVQVVTHLAVLHFEKGDSAKALRYAKVAKKLGQKFSDTYAEGLGDALLEELKLAQSKTQG